MRYYVIADVHSFYSEMMDALKEQGYFEDAQPHKLIICGDLLDRGQEAVAMRDFVLELLSRDEVILIRGNHEDLALDLINHWHLGSYRQFHHFTNGTIDTACQLAGYCLDDFPRYVDEVGRAFLKDPMVQTVIPRMVDFFETEHYIFVHGWIPCKKSVTDEMDLIYEAIPDWRGAAEANWKKARWLNGMEAAHYGITEPGKTIVCGHFHCSFGHAKYENDGGEYDDQPNFAPYYAPGIIALDACTKLSRRVNCIVIED